MIKTNVTNVLLQSTEKVNNGQPLYHCGLDFFACKLYCLTAKQLDLIASRCMITNGVLQLASKANVFYFKQSGCKLKIEIVNSGYGRYIKFKFKSQTLRRMQLKNTIEFISNFFKTIGFNFGSHDQLNYLNKNLKTDELEVFVDVLADKAMYDNFFDCIDKIGTLKKKLKQNEITQAKLNLKKQNKYAIAASEWNTKDDMLNFKYRFFASKNDIDKNEEVDEEENTNKSQVSKCYFKIYNKLNQICNCPDSAHWFECYRDHLQLSQENLEIIKNNHHRVTEDEGIKIYNHFKKADISIMRIEYGVQHKPLKMWLRRKECKKYAKFENIYSVINNVNLFMLFMVKNILSVSLVNDANGRMESWDVTDGIMEMLKSNATYEPGLNGFSDADYARELFENKKQITKLTPGNVSRIMNNIVRFDDISSDAEFESYCSKVLSEIHRVEDLVGVRLAARGKIIQQYGALFGK